MNQYESDGDSYWRSLSHFRPIQNTTFGSILLKQSFYMKFNLIWHGFSDDAQSNFEGVFRIGIPSTNVYDCFGHATRYPALYIDKNNKAIQFTISDDIDCWGVGLLNITYDKLKENIVYTIIIKYNQSSVYIEINNEILFNGKRPGNTPNTMLYTKQAIMISDGLDPAANITLYDISIISYDNILSLYPTISPTQSPTVKFLLYLKYDTKFCRCLDCLFVLYLDFNTNKCSHR